MIFYVSLVSYFFTIVLPANIIPPIRANALPSSDAPVLNVMDCIARIFPLNSEVVPKVAELL